MARQDREGERHGDDAQKGTMAIGTDLRDNARATDLHIKAHELLLVLQKVEAPKRYDTANRIRSTCSQIFRYAIATAYAKRDVASDLRALPCDTPYKSSGRHHLPLSRLEDC